MLDKNTLKIVSDEIDKEITEIEWKYKRMGWGMNCPEIQGLKTLRDRIKKLR